MMSQLNDHCTKQSEMLELSVPPSQIIKRHKYDGEQVVHFLVRLIKMQPRFQFLVFHSKVRHVFFLSAAASVSILNIKLPFTNNKKWPVFGGHFKKHFNQIHQN